MNKTAQKTIAYKFLDNLYEIRIVVALDEDQLKFHHQL